MKKRRKSALALLLTLCLAAAWLPTAAWAAEDPTTVEASAEGAKAGAGVPVTKITLTAANGSFAANQDASNYSISIAESFGSDGEISVDGAARSTSGDNIVDLTVTSFTPTKKGRLTITINKAAFENCNLESESITTTLQINAADWLREGEGLTTKVTDGMKAGVNGGTVTLTISDGFTNTFVNTSSTDNYFISDAGSTNLTLTSVTAEGKEATLTFSGTPTAAGTIKVRIQATAFKFQPATGVGSEIGTNDVFIDPADTPTVTASGSGLTAGTEGTIDLSITGGANTFVSSPSEDLFAVKVDGAEQTVTDAGAGGASTTLTFTPGKTGAVSVEIKPGAFTYQPADTVTATGGPITVSAPTVEASASGELTQGVANGAIEVNITSDNDTFKSGLSVTDAGLFTVKVNGGESLSPTNVTGGGTTAALTMPAPTQKGAISVEIDQSAFSIPASGKVTTASTAKVVAPNGSVTATLEGGDLYAGTKVSGQTIKLTANGLTFADDEPNTGNFTLDGDGKEGLEVTDAAYTSGTEVSLTLSGTPTNQGAVDVKIKQAAFKYQPDTEVTAKGVTVKAAPEVKLSGDSIVAGQTDKVTVKISSGNARFASGDITGKFAVSGIGGIGVKTVTVADSGSDALTAEITLSAVPTEKGILRFEVQPDAFTPVASGSVTADITVSAPSGSVTGELADGGTLTAGTDATGVKITLTADGDLKFKSTASQGDLTLGEGAGGLEISGVAVDPDGKTATLTLSGIPEAGGSFTVTAQEAAFVASPGETKATGDITIAYPSITLEADPDHLAEEDDTIHAFTLKAAGGTFKEPAELSDFSFSANITGIEPQDVSVDGDTATLTFTGTATSAGELTITVQPRAFQYQPQTAPTAKVTVGKPSGDLSADLDGTLHAGAAADGVTITVDITVSHGLHFKDSIQPSDFKLTGGAIGGLTIQKVEFINTFHAVLTLSGTPTTAGTFQVEAQTTAFHMAPGAAITASGGMTVGTAQVSVTPGENQLQAGEEDRTFTLTVTGSAFADSVSEGDLSITDAGAVQGSLAVKEVVRSADGKTLTVTLGGAPATTGTLTFSVRPTAFEPAPEAAVTVTVDVAPGQQQSESEVQPGASDTNFAMPLDDLAAAVLTPEEVALYEAGAKVDIILETSNMTDTIPADDKAAVEKAADGYTVGEYLDVSLYKTINNAVAEAITETRAPIKVVFTIPKSLQAANREFVIVRLHDGVAAVLKTISSTASSVTIETNQFSTYAIAYRTVKASQKAAPTAPNTGDAAPLPGMAALLLGCGAALALALKKRREHE